MTSQSQNLSISRSIEHHCNRRLWTNNIKNKLKNTKLTRKWWKDSCQLLWRSKATPNGHMDGTKIKLKTRLPGTMLETTRRRKVISHNRVKQMVLSTTSITTITSMATLITSISITVKTNPIKLTVPKMEGQMVRNSRKLRLTQIQPQSKMKELSNNLPVD